MPATPNGDADCGQCGPNCVASRTPASGQAPAEDASAAGRPAEPHTEYRGTPQRHARSCRERLRRRERRLVAGPGPGALTGAASAAAPLALAPRAQATMTPRPSRTRARQPITLPDICDSSSLRQPTKRARTALAGAAAGTAPRQQTLVPRRPAQGQHDALHAEPASAGSGAGLPGRVRG